MRREDVPVEDGYRPVQCTRCGDWLAVPLDVTADDVDTILHQHAEMRHRTPTDWPSEVRFMLEQVPGHDPETYCPGEGRGDLGHCGHWHYGAPCCDCGADAEPLPSFQAPRGSNLPAVAGQLPVSDAMRELLDATGPPAPPLPDVVLHLSPEALDTYRRALEGGHLDGILSLVGSNKDVLLLALIAEVERLRSRPNSG